MAETPENRSEIVLLYDARDTNPNGNPLAADNPPRVDAQTNQAIVTDVRLKRYIRDELFDLGHNILVKSPEQMYGDDFTQGAASRAALVADILDELEYDDLSEADDTEIFSSFLDVATDVRYFGATFATDSEHDSDEVSMPSSVTGAVQFGHGRSLNPVSLNTESKQLSSVVASGEGKQQGTFASDNRLHYALIAFGGVVNERLAEKSQLTQEDVERLDDVIWSALLNQTTTRSKMGQSPRFYARVEYNGNRQKFAGNVETAFEMNSEQSLESVRGPSEYTVDISEFVTRLEQSAETVDTVHLRVDPQMEFTDGEETYVGEEVQNALPVNTVLV